MKYDIEQTPDRSVLTISGRLDTLSASELEQAIAPIAANPPAHLEVAIPDLSYISSSGLRCFVQLYNACRKRGSEMRITGMQPAVKEIFDLTGFSKLFGV